MAISTTESLPINRSFTLLTFVFSVLLGLPLLVVSGYLPKATTENGDGSMLCIKPEEKCLKGEGEDCDVVYSRDSGINMFRTFNVVAASVLLLYGFVNLIELIVLMNE